MPPSNLSVQSFAPPPINRAIRFTSGPFVGSSVRAELDELQKADVGRKCGNRDRRPLDPPPVTRLRLFETINEGTPHQVEREITDVKSEAVAYGFMCFVDLLPWPPSVPELEQGLEERPGRSLSLPTMSSPSELGSDRLPYSASVTTELDDELDLTTADNDAPSSSRLNAGGVEEPLAQPNAAANILALEPPPPPFVGVPILPWQFEQEVPRNHIAAIVDGIPVPEITKCTHAFVGSTFVQGATFHYDGLPSLLFVFSDLACNREGTFLLRYRVANIFSTAVGIDHMPVLAECWGGPVTIYSTKTFPGLAESTELTKCLSRLGVPVNIRQTERKKRQRRQSGSLIDDTGPSGSNT